MTVRDLTAREWIERARETLRELDPDDEDTTLGDIDDDLSRALELMGDDSETRNTDSTARR